VRRRVFASGVKDQSLTLGMHPKRDILSMREVGRIHGVAVKCVDIMRNTSGEGGLLAHY
jgi:hypothetical protein